jgi:hypothetical protein
MKSSAISFAIVALTTLNGTLPPHASCAEEKASPVHRWEYRVLSKAQILDLGKKDFAAGLNRLGDEGWEFVAVDAAYIFKRPKAQQRPQVVEVKDPVAAAEAKVEQQKGHLAWAERMARAGRVTEQEVEAARAQLKRAEFALKVARIKQRVAIAEVKVEQQKGHLGWAERMVRAGRVTKQELEAAREQLRQAELVLEAARKELKAVSPDPTKRSPDKERKPEK